MRVRVAMALLGETVQDVTARDGRTQREYDEERGETVQGRGEKGSESLRGHSYLFAC